MIIRKYIQKILEETNYEVSLNNSYISGIKNEWDIIIVYKKNVKKEEQIINIYEPEHVKCVIELKNSDFF